MTDLTPYRGKRALVCGIPCMEAKTHEAWSAVLRSVLKPAGIKGPIVSGFRAWLLAAELEARPRDLVMIASCGWARFEEVATAARKAGVPVLRVRRDGSVEVDDGM